MNEVNQEESYFLSYPLYPKPNKELPIVTPSQLFASMGFDRKESAILGLEQKQLVVEQWITSHGQPQGLLRDLLIDAGIELLQIPEEP